MQAAVLEVVIRLLVDYFAGFTGERNSATLGLLPCKTQVVVQPLIVSGATESRFDVAAGRPPWSVQ